jgi:hypothetical protein
MTDCTPVYGNIQNATAKAWPASSELGYRQNRHQIWCSWVSTGQAWFVGGRAVWYGSVLGAPASPMVPDNAPAGTVVAAAIVEMSHSLPFIGTVTIAGMNIVTACALTSADDTTHTTIAAHHGGQSLSARISV